MLLADLIDVIRGLMPLILAIGWGIWQMVSAMNEAGKGKRAAAKRAAGQQGGLKSEVDELLRQLKGQAEPAPQQPAAEPRQPKKPRRPRIEVLVDDEPSKSARETPRLLVRERAAPERPRHDKQKPNRKRSPGARAEQAAHLSERIAQAGERAEASVHEKFDHDLGSLAGVDEASDQPYAQAEEGATASETTTAESIAAMLRDPDNVRNAVILNEILRRPAI